MRSADRVLSMLALLAVITYVDRVCISVAGPRMQRELDIGPEQWGWVTGAFALAYALFEIPSGRMGDRFGPRRVLTRIVCWWSMFTAATGAVSGFRSLVAARFCFGAGESGAFPNMSTVVSSRFPAERRARAFGVIWTASQLGAALAPALVIPVQVYYGWRASFFLFASVGVIWGVAWHRWYRDIETSGPRVTLPWRTVAANKNVRALMGVAFCFCYAMYFFLAWLPTYLAKARGFSERQLAWSTIPFLLGAAANGLGGIAGDALVSRFGLARGRRSVGFGGLAVALICICCALTVRTPAPSLTLLSLAYAGLAFQQPAVWSVCVDIGRESSGTVSGFMNTAAQAGSFAFSISYGYLVQRTADYDLSLLPAMLLLGVGILLWTRVDAAMPVSERHGP
ncbi:MAG: MFS transporter [Bryobacteraceae bacterium]